MSLTNNLNAYKEIAQDYLNYLDQHADNSSDLKKTAPLSSWRNTFTGNFYQGRHARFILWDILAGHVKNNFFFKWFKKAEHADFIALVDRIVKLDHDPKEILNSIINSKSQDELFDCLVKYFISLQNSAISKNDAYHSSMKALKRDINHFARECNIERRLVKMEG